jgi:hypothetical protein
VEGEAAETGAVSPATNSEDKANKEIETTITVFVSLKLSPTKTRHLSTETHA